MTNTAGGGPARFRDVTIGHGTSRRDAVADARVLAGCEVEVVADCEIAGTWTVLTRRASTHTRRRPVARASA